MVNATILKHKLRMLIHKWGIPISHAGLWILGLLVTTDYLGKLKDYFTEEEIYAVSIGTVVVIFFLEIVLTFVDVVIEKKITVLNVNFLKFVALLVTAMVILVVLMFLGCHFLPNDLEAGRVYIRWLIIVSAFTKGMQVWLQNNWSEYVVDVANREPIMNYSN